MNLDEVRAYTGKEIGVSEWFALDQDKINGFADLTEDHMFLHVNVGAAIRPIELGYQDYVDGRMSEELWAGQRNTLVYWFSRPGFYKWLEEYGHTSQPSFISYIQNLILEGDV